MYQSNRSLNIPPPGIPWAFDVFSCPGGREFDELSLPRVGHLITSHRGWGIWSLVSISCHESRVINNHGEDKPSCIQSERYPIRGGLAEKQRLAQALFCIWRYSRAIYIIFGMYECCLLNHVYIHSFRSIIKATEKFPGGGDIWSPGMDLWCGIWTAFRPREGRIFQKFSKNSNARGLPGGGCWSFDLTGTLCVDDKRSHLPQLSQAVPTAMSQVGRWHMRTRLKSGIPNRTIVWPRQHLNKRHDACACLHATPFWE